MEFLILPSILIFLGFVYSIYDTNTSYGMFQGMAGGIVFLISIIASICLIIGHFI